MNFIIQRTLCVISIILLSNFTAKAQLPVDGVDTLQTATLGYDLDINISIDKAPELYSLSTMAIELTANNNAVEDLKIEVITPDSISVDTSKVSRQLERLSLDSVYQNTVSFVVNQPGQHKITLKVTGLVDGQRYTDRYEYLYFTTSKDRSLNKLDWDNGGKSEEERSEYLPLQKYTYQEDSQGYIEVAMADENLNMVTKKIKASDFYSSQKGQSGMVTVSGILVMRTRDENTADTYPYANSLVQLLHGVSGAHRAWTYTNSQGGFTFPAIANPGIDGIIIRMYAVRFITGGLGYGVCNKGFCSDNAAADPAQYSLFYSLLTSQRTDIPDGAFNYGTHITVNNTNLRAMWIKHDMDDAHRHLLQNSSVRGPFTAEWHPSSTDGNYYSIGGNIHFKADVTDGTNHTVLHELGHNVMYNAGTFPTTPTDCPNPHYVQSISGTQCAWTEGWASAFANMVNDDPTRCFAPSATNCISYETAPSIDECFPSWDCGIDGHKVEGHVTGALWDLYDADDDGLDINSYGSNEIYAVMELSPYSAFLSWWSIWKAQGFPFEAANSLYQNAIEFTQSYDIDLYSINATGNAIRPIEGQYVSISVWLKNIGDATSVGSPVTLYSSFISTFTGFEPAILTYDLGLIEKDEQSLAYYYLPDQEPGTTYYRACYADQHGLDENPANNCSAVISVEVLPDVIFVNGFE